MAMTEASARTAADALRRAFQSVHGREPTVNELAILAGHAYLESNWGRARFRSYPEGVAPGSLKTCPRPPDRGTFYSPPLNNWGSVQIRAAQSTPENSWGPGCDSNRRGIYPVNFRRYATPADGARHYVAVATTQHGRKERTMPTLAAGDVPAYVDAQLATRYFEVAPISTREAKIRGIDRAARQFAKLTGLPFPERVTLPALTTPGGVSAAVLALGGAVALGVVYAIAQEKRT